MCDFLYALSLKREVGHTISILSVSITDHILRIGDVLFPSRSNAVCMFPL